MFGGEGASGLRAMQSLFVATQVRTVSQSVGVESWGVKGIVPMEMNVAHNASSRFKSSLMSTSIVSGYETVSVSVHGSDGSNLMVSRMRSSAICSWN